jgi:protein required for attachment to host cells
MADPNRDGFFNGTESPAHRGSDIGIESDHE